jgi:hypothetical protein
MLLGVVIGIIFGILPGVSGLTAMAILLPFVFRMPQEYALALFAVIAATSPPVVPSKRTAPFLRKRGALFRAPSFPG